MSSELLNVTVFGDWSMHHSIQRSLQQNPYVGLVPDVEFERDDDSLFQPNSDPLPSNTNPSEPKNTSPPTPSPSDIPLSQLQLDPTPPTFTLFPNLPKELRLEIWQFSHPPPRNVILAFPQNRRTRARIPGWDKQWIFPVLDSHFASLLVNREAREFFLVHYQIIFAEFPSNEEKKKEGKRSGWYFNPMKDSLCFGDGVRGLRWFMNNFPGDDVWSRVRYIDVDVDLRAFHRTKAVEGYMAGEETSASCLAKMKELKLVSMRVVVVRQEQWKSRGIGHWRPWANSGRILKDWLMSSAERKSSIKLAMQYIWIEMGGHVSSIEENKAFLARYPGVLSEAIRMRWAEMGIFLRDGGNKTQAVYNTDREIFCQNLEIRLQEDLEGHTEDQNATSTI